MIRYILIGIVGFLIHGLLTFGNIFNSSSHLNLLFLYDQIARNQSEILAFLIAILISGALSFLFLTIRIYTGRTLEQKPIKETVFFFGGAVAFYLALLLFVWWVFKDFLSFS